MENETKKTKNGKKGFNLKSGIQAGYWSCTGVSGPTNKKGQVSPAYASQCWKDGRVY